MWIKQDLTSAIGKETNLSLIFCQYFPNICDYLFARGYRRPKPF